MHCYVVHHTGQHNWRHSVQWRDSYFSLRECYSACDPELISCAIHRAVVMQSNQTNVTGPAPHPLLTRRDHSAQPPSAASGTESASIKTCTRYVPAILG